MRLVARSKRFYKATFCILFFTLVSVLVFNTMHAPLTTSGKTIDENRWDFSDSNNETGYPFYVVPNIVHLVYFIKDSNSAPDLSFIQVVTIKAAHRHQRPDKIMIHSDCDHFHGKYWDMVKDLVGLEVKYMTRPTQIFGRNLGSVFKLYHASDIARILLLMRYGGIYIDGDTYIVKSLDKYRKFEMTLGWKSGHSLLTQVLIANKNARFLKLWYETYRDYRSNKFYYNAGDLPSSYVVLLKPDIVHQVTRDFGDSLTSMLYMKQSDKWKTYDTIHLLSRHTYVVKSEVVPVFDEDNIKTYNRSFGQMARLALFGSTDLIS